MKRSIRTGLLERMISLGIMPVIPAFNGIVPTELLDLYPNETYYPLRHGFGHSGHEGYKLAKQYLKDQNLPQITRSN
jgi:hypothetical protein